MQVTAPDTKAHNPWGAGEHQPGGLRRVPGHHDPFRRAPRSGNSSLRLLHPRLVDPQRLATIVFAALLIPAAGRLADRVGGARRSSPPPCSSPSPDALWLWPRRSRRAGSRHASCKRSPRPRWCPRRWLWCSRRSSPQDPGSRRDLGRCRCRQRRSRTDIGCAGDREPRLALGVLHQPAGRHRQLLPRPTGASRMARVEPRPPP